MTPGHEVSVDVQQDDFSGVGDVAKRGRSSGISYPVAYLVDELVWASDLAEAGDRPNGLVCVGCGHDLTLKAGTRKRPHFAHRKTVDCYGTETVLHQIAKRVIAASILAAIERGDSYLASWTCGLCRCEHTTDLAVGSVHLERTFAQVRPDVAVVDQADVMAAAVEVVVTHRPDEAATDWYRSHRIPVFETAPTWDSLEGLRTRLECSHVHQDAIDAADPTQLVHRDGTPCGDVRKFSEERVAAGIESGFNRARRAGRSYWAHWLCETCGREQHTDLAAHYTSARATGPALTIPPSIWFSDHGQASLVVELAALSHEQQYWLGRTDKVVFHVAASLDSRETFDDGFGVAAARGSAGAGDAFRNRHFDGSFCCDTAAGEQAKESLAERINAARREQKPFRVSVPCRPCSATRTVDLASANRVGKAAANVGMGDVTADVVIYDTSGTERIALTVNPRGQQFDRFDRSSYRNDNNLVSALADSGLRVLEVELDADNPADSECVVTAARGMTCDGWRHPENPTLHTCRCGQPVRSLRFELARGTQCPGCGRPVPVLDIVETDAFGYQDPLTASDPSLVGVEQQADGLPVKLRMNSTKQRSAYLMHHCPQCGYKIGDHFQYEDARHRRLLARSEVSHRLLCDAGHWTVLRTTTVPAGQPPRRMWSHLLD